jgi:type III secretion protein T
LADLPPLSNLSVFAPLLAAMPRIGAAIAVVPLFPGSVFPSLLRGTVVISLSLYSYPYMAAQMPADLSLLAWLGLIAKEVLIGVLLGLGVGALVWVFEGVGAMIDLQVGFSNARVFDPFGGHEAAPLGQFMTRLGVVLFVAGGGLQVLASLLIESFHLWPAAAFHPSITGQLAGFAGGSAQSLAELTVRMAVPAVLLLALIDLGFGLVNRVVPQLNVFFFTMPIKGALAALMLALYLSYLSDVMAGQLSGLQGWLEHLTPVLAPH